MGCLATWPAGGIAGSEHTRPQPLSRLTDCDNGHVASLRTCQVLLGVRTTDQQKYVRVVHNPIRSLWVTSGEMT